ncbi:predicted protein [Scheffersomyces stipitis CBS 6054]|uniref:RRM domain-containing protein n=1 Tax=Scheffersomyces stipitis (strain ATCC 58785 / CBS 6054 / NBRC 10063 / NRRL Y-11545) TaxID=322104 RepID=A3LPV2_PICST|nr:predicted protein [Scheffersomyces stipitis CBS 6054]ABN64563.2 predicted protein [Scheffersomyces stipitis CBS 6054]KAG2736001.1 hypothetical protein G9P44_000091 [Scheffersomyces stipitis]
MSSASPHINTIYVHNLNDKVSLKKLRQSLDEIFNKFGTIIQITAHKNLKMKGQAFITFETAESAAKALVKLQNHQLFNKPIKIQYAKTNSDNYFTQVANDPKPIETRKELKAKQQTKKRTADESEQKPQKKKIKIDDWKKLPPNKILLLQNLSGSVDQTKLSSYFEQFAGFVTARLVKARNLSFVEFENDSASTECISKVDSVVLKENFGDEAFLTYAKK